MWRARNWPFPTFSQIPIFSHCCQEFAGPGMWWLVWGDNFAVCSSNLKAHRIWKDQEEVISGVLHIYGMHAKLIFSDFLGVNSFVCFSKNLQLKSS